VGALEEGSITGLGRAMFRLPLDASFSRVLIEATQGDYPEPVRQALVDLTALLNLDRPLFLPPPDGGRGEDVLEARRVLAEAGCDAAVLVRAFRSGRAGELALNPAVLGEARKVAGQVRSLLNVGPPGDGENERVDSRGMALAWLRAVPGSAFVPRARRDAWANDSGVELVLSRGTALKAGSPALVAAARRTVVGRGGRKTTFATCALPADFKLLVEAGLGRVSTGRIRLERGRIVAVSERRYAGVLLESGEEEPRGEAARQAVARLIMANRLLKGAGAEVAEAVDRHNLRCRLAPETGQEIVDTEGWLAARLRALGLEQGSDLEMVSAEDLLPDGPDAEAEAEFDRRFPRRINLGNLQCRVEYDPAGKLITLVREAGVSRQPPDPRYLPPWPGWRIRFRDRQRVVPVRG
jgi:ATP-dependent helicase HrpB